MKYVHSTNVKDTNRGNAYRKGYHKITKVEVGLLSWFRHEKGAALYVPALTVSNLTEAGEEAARKVCFGVVADWTV